MKPIPVAISAYERSQSGNGSATKHDTSQWPLVVTKVSGLQDLKATCAFVGNWNDWLSRQKPFATLRIFADSDALVHPKGSGPILTAWLQAKAAAIKANMIGMATVVPVDQYEKRLKMSAERLFGVPAATFSSIAAALDWLEERVFNPRGLPFDRAAITNLITAIR